VNSNQSFMLLLGRILIGLLFLVAGIRKTMSITATAAYMTKGGVPMADVLVYGTIALEILGGLALIIGWKTKPVAWILGLFIVIITPIFHGFWSVPPEQYSGQLNHFLKNIAIIGGLAYVATFGAGSMSADKTERA
jgi:putative oxidoreductase